MTLDQITSTFNSFFKDDKQKVLFLKGPWGSGKSFFVRRYLSQNNSVIPAFQYFVSLFGLETLRDVRETMNSSLEIRTMQKGESNGFLGKAFRSVGKASDFLKKLPNIYGLPVGTIGSSLFWLVAKNQPSIIVFDDLERAKIPAHTVLGLASSLAENSKAKIIIVFNEDELDKEELKKVNEYREKVVDVEILFEPSIKDIVDNYLLEKSISESVVEILANIRSSNIRLLNKINNHLARFKELATEEGVQLSIEELVRAVKIVCLRYMSKRQITSEMLENGLFGLFLKKESATDEDKQLDELAKDLKMFPAYPLDVITLELVQNGYCSVESRHKYFDKYRNNQVRDEFTSDLRKAYAKYGNNFTGTVDEVFADMEWVLNKHSNVMLTEHFVGHLNFLRELGYSKSTEAWKEMHLALLNKFPKSPDRIAAARALLPSQVASDYIAKLESERKAPSDPLSIIRRITKSQSWHHDDIEALALMSEDEIFNWICTCQDDRFIDSLREIYKMWSNSESTEPFWKKLDAALTRVANRSKLDEVRVKNLFKFFQQHGH